MNLFELALLIVVGMFSAVGMIMLVCAINDNRSDRRRR